MDRTLRTGVTGVMLGMITAPLDGMMLGPALPSIVRDLGGLEYFFWVATAYHHDHHRQQGRAARHAAAKALLDQVTWWARTLRDARTTTPYTA
ncbi:hypothetical protein [Nonomuraea indica]|uniref:Uncharacterized protein n=1 Tax=Nonomuraea indica TaxID=1581193 RepID=A0ABW8ADA2_9ACTN